MYTVTITISDIGNPEYNNIDIDKNEENMLLLHNSNNIPVSLLYNSDSDVIPPVITNE